MELPPQRLARAMREADGLLCTVTDRVDAGCFGAAGRRVRIVANFGVGVNNIDLAAAEAAGVAVSNTPGVLTDATADIAIALMLAATRRMSETEAILRAGGWDGWRPTGWLGMGLQGKTLGIIEQHFQQVLGREALVPLAQSQRLRRLHEAPRALGVAFEIHR